MRSGICVQMITLKKSRQQSHRSKLSIADKSLLERENRWANWRDVDGVQQKVVHTPADFIGKEWQILARGAE